MFSISHFLSRGQIKDVQGVKSPREGPSVQIMVKNYINSFIQDTLKKKNKLTIQK